ncbi:MAG: hypothetical protein PHD56_08000 [Anaerostipes sp.]|nr:hypothetical protein [Anaerostipes sp.]
MHGLEHLEFDNHIFFKEGKWLEEFEKEFAERELIEVLFQQWRKTKDKDEFLVLFVKIWLKLEDIYMHNIEKYYKKKCYEKELFYKLLDYGKEEFSNDYKFILMTGYIYCTTDYLFILDEVCENEMENKGKKMICELYSENNKDFLISCFYYLIFDRKKYKKVRREKSFGKRIMQCFPSDCEIDRYFREVLS